MFGSIYSGMSGLQAFSQGLDVVSNNVANLNTPGFKASDVLFRDLFYSQEQALSYSGNNSSQIGNGVATSGTSLRFLQGDTQTTGVNTDLAIEGNGLFILREQDATFYTRTGQFDFDSEGFLVSRNTTTRVAGLDENGNLIDINISGLRTNPAVATTEVTFNNNLSTGSTDHSLSNVQIIDTLGGTHDLTVVFTNNNTVIAGSWLAEVQDVNGNILVTDEEIRFSTDGTPVDGFNKFVFSLQPQDAGNVDITFDFGVPGGFGGATSFSAGTISNLSVNEANGTEVGALVSIEFDASGRLNLDYSNGETVESEQLALAWFENLQSLQQIGEGLFLAPENSDLIIDSATNNVMGEILGGSLELSNVDLTREFTDLIIIQRGFQASSQVLSASNEIIQELINVGKGG